jgi:uncharacterized alpha-E superfamily protein
MLSRVADSVFWMSRYLERAENVARFVEVNHHLSLDLGGGLREQWEPLVATTGDHELFRKKYDAPTQTAVLRFLTFDLDNPNSILSCLRCARENARTVRDIITGAVWEEINKLYLAIRSASRDPSLWETPYEFFQHVKRSSQTIFGLADVTMLRDEAWHFCDVGRLIERADKTSRILDVKYFILLPQSSDVGTPLDSIQWGALLKSADGLEMYRRSRGRITSRNVVDFLMFDREFPRSMRFCLARSEESVRAVTGTRRSTYVNEAGRRLGLLRAEFDYSNVDDVIAGGLHEYIDHFQTKLNQLGAAIIETFFSGPPVKDEPQLATAVR